MITKAVGAILILLAVAVGFFDFQASILGQIPIPFCEQLAGMVGYTTEWWRMKITATVSGVVGWFLLRH